MNIMLSENEVNFLNFFDSCMKKIHGGYIKNSTVCSKQIATLKKLNSQFSMEAATSLLSAYTELYLSIGDEGKVWIPTILTITDLRTKWDKIEISIMRNKKKSYNRNIDPKISFEADGIYNRIKTDVTNIFPSHLQQKNLVLGIITQLLMNYNQIKSWYFNQDGSVKPVMTMDQNTEEYHKFCSARRWYSNIGTVENGVRLYGRWISNIPNYSDFNLSVFLPSNGFMWKKWYFSVTEK